MKRIARWSMLAVFTLATPITSLAQNGIARVGLLRSSQPPDPFTQAFIDEMQALGYVEGQTIVYERRWAKEIRTACRPHPSRASSGLCLPSTE